VKAIEYARTSKTPFLGVCLGLQCAVIEYARNVLGWEDAHSAEFNPESAHQVVVRRPAQPREHSKLKIAIHTCCVRRFS